MTALQSIVALCFGVSFAAAAASLADKPDSTYVTDGPVNAIVRAGDTIYIGGQFSRLGPRTGPGVEVALDGTENVGLPEISGAGPTLAGIAGTGVRAVVADGSGGWYVGGLFTHVGGVVRTNLAHIRGDHSVDPSFGPSFDGGVNALALSGSILYVGGLYTSIDGQPRSNVAALSTADGSVTAFNPNADAAAGRGVGALAVSGDGAIVYVGGDFTEVGGEARSGIAALNAADGSATSTFNPGIVGGTGSADSLVIADSILYVAGNFSTVGGLTRQAIAAIHLGGADDGTVVADFAPAPTFFGCVPCASIAALAVSGSTVYAGGSFDTIGGQARNNLAGLDAADGTATAFDPSPAQNILSLAASGSIVYVGGGFVSIGGQARNYIAALNATDGSATAFDPDPNGTPNAIGVSGTAVYFGGQFSSLGGVLRSSLAAINAADGTPTAWDAHAEGMNGNYALVNALAVSGSAVYVGGAFTTIGGHARNNAAALTIADATATAWNPDVDGSVNAIAVSGDVAYVGGSFQNIGGQPHLGIAALDTVDGTANAWEPNADFIPINAIALSGNLVYFGGTFAHVGGEPRNGLAAVNAADASVTSWNPDLGADLQGFIGVYALAVSGTTVYTGGAFGSVQGATRNNIAGINAADGSPTDFNPNASAAEFTNAYVVALAVDDSTVYAGGYFNAIGGQPRALLAALDASDGSATSFDPDGSGGNAVYALTVVSDGTLYVGGSFPTFDLAYQQGFAAFTPVVPNEMIFSDGFDGP